MSSSKYVIEVHRTSVNVTRRFWNHTAAAISSTWSMFIVFLIMCMPQVSLCHTNLDTLSVLLPGRYTNLQQYQRHASRDLPATRRNIFMKRDIFLVEPPMFHDNLTIFYQDFSRFSQIPITSGIFSFMSESDTPVIRMRTFKLKNNLKLSLRVLDNKKEDYVINRDDMIKELGGRLQQNGTFTGSTRDCDTFWKRISKKTFVGITGPMCLGQLGQDKVRIGVSMTLTDKKILLTEAWHRMTDGAQLKETSVPYVLVKQKKKRKRKAKRRKQRTRTQPSWQFLETLPARSKIDNQQVETLSDQPRSDIQKNMVKHPHSLTSNEKISRSKNKKNHRKLKNHKFDSMTRLSDSQGAPIKRNLGKFKQVAAALVFGYDVSFRSELSACSMPSQVRLNRLSFGGKVKDFVYVRADGRNNKRIDYIFFQVKKTVVGYGGPELITRSLTLYRNGRVEVKVTTALSDPYEKKMDYTFHCKLYNDQKGYGGVQLFIDSNSHVNALSSFNALSSALNQGGGLRLVTDLSRCRGALRKPAIVFGTYVTEYDLTNGGKTVEVSIKIPEPMISVSQNGNTPTFNIIGQLMKNGDVIFTRADSFNSVLPIKYPEGSQLSIGHAFHCKLSKRSSLETNDENENSVKLFYVK